MNSRLRGRLFALLALACVLHLDAQPPESLAVPVAATSEDIHNWLLGTDPRMVAWGAYFAAQNRDPAMLPYLQRLAAEWQPMPRYNGDGSSIELTETEQAREKATACVLDALVQMHSSVEPEAIEPLSANFAAQALTLFAYMPGEERRALAISIYAQRQVVAEGWADGNARNAFQNFQYGMDLLLDPNPSRTTDFNEARRTIVHSQLVRMAAGILANDPPPGLAASLLSDTTVDLELSVGATDQESWWGASCGDRFGRAQPKDWPPPWTYVVEEHWSSQALSGVEIIVPGEPALTTRRAETSNSCSTMGRFSSTARIELLAQMLGLTNRSLGWTLDEYSQLPDADGSAFRTEALGAIAMRERAFAATAAALAAKGWMTPEETATSRPMLYIAVRDARETKTPDLPPVPLPYPKTAEVRWLSH